MLTLQRNVVWTTLYPNGVFSPQAEEQLMQVEDYVGIIQDALVMGKNVCIMRQ